MIAPKVVCIAVCLYRLFSTTSGTASRLSSITMRMPSRSDSSRRSLMPSIFLSRARSAMFFTRFDLLTMYGISVTTICERPLDSFSSTWARARIPRRIAVDRAEVALAVHQGIAQREVLDHADHGVVDRAVAVRVVLAQDVADHRRALLVGPSGNQSQLVHRVQNPPVHRLQAVAHIGQGATHDDAHRVVDERLAHL